VSREIVFELCAESVEACIAGQRGGADRIELCTALVEDGLTPSHGLVRLVLDRCTLPVHVLVRPRAGDFLYSDAEFAVMEEDIRHLKAMGVSGFVVGILSADATVDIPRTRKLVELADPLEVTFNRAFDYTADIDRALEDVIVTGCKRILTSGGEEDVVAGAAALARLVKQADGRVEIAVGGGLRIEDAAELAATTRARHFHGSLRQSDTAVFAGSDGGNSIFFSGSPAAAGALRSRVVESDDIRALVTRLRYS
jgi:copper homeostasis protein